MMKRWARATQTIGRLQRAPRWDPPRKILANTALGFESDPEPWRRLRHAPCDAGHYWTLTCIGQRMGELARRRLALDAGHRVMGRKGVVS
jgi:hypothetical protein